MNRMLTKNSIHMGMKLKNRLSNTAIYAILIVMSIVWLIPFFCIFFESFRVETTAPAGYIIPKQWGFDNYINLFQSNDSKQFGQWYLNTFLIGLATAILQLIFVLCMSYTLSRTRFKGRKPLMKLMLILGMFPGFIAIIVLYFMLKGTGGEGSYGLTNVNSPFGLVLTYVASSGMGYYVSKGFFDTIPKSLDEAARVDGATRLQVLTKVILPMSKPIIIYTVLMGFMAPWGDFMTARYFARDGYAGMNVAAGLQFLISTPSNTSAYYTQFCAGGVLVAIPITVLFMLLQRYYVEGVTGGAVKG